MNRWILLLFFVGLASCADPRATAVDETTDETPDEIDEQPTGATTVISETGGTLSSEDGLFTVEIPPFVLSQPVQLTIEAEAPSGVPSSFSAISQGYSVLVDPSDAIPSEGAAIRVSFRLEEEIALANDFDSATIYSQIETEEGVTPWSLQETSNDADTLALWSFVENTVQTFAVFVPVTCGCDTTDECDDSCDCDPACEDEPTDTSDASDAADTSDPSDTVSCSSTEFQCNDQACIPLIRLCDGLPDCNDGSDELSCDGVSIQNDEYEPDDNFENATLIEVDGPQVHTLPASDQDYYSFRTLEIQDVVITTRGSSGDTVITLYNESRAQISSEDDGGSGEFARLEERSLPPGTYYFRITNGTAGPTGIHTVEVFTSAPLRPGPTGLSATMDGEAVRVTWNAVDGTDSYNLYYGLSRGGPYTSNQATEGSSPLSTSATTLDLNGFVPETTVFFVVSAITGGVESYVSSEVSLLIPVPEDVYEPNNDISEAQPIESGVAQNHSISPAGDVDYFTFDLEVPSSVVLRTSGTSGDTKLYLLNSEGAQINYNDDGGDGFFSLISESRLEAGTYYGYVSAFSTASEIPAYQLTYTAESLIQIDAQEPNDTISEATALTDSSATGSLHTPEDIDIYVVSIPDNAEVNLNLSVTSGSATVSLLDESGSAVSTSSPTGSSSETTLSVNRPPAGTYYIQIESVDGLVENYTLSFEALIYPTIPADIVVDVSAGGDISISWTAVPGATSYDIEYFYSGDLSEPNAANWQVATEGPSPLSAPTPTITITGLPNTEATFIRVRSLNGTATSEWSATVSTAN